MQLDLVAFKFTDMMKYAHANLAYVFITSKAYEFLSENPKYI